MGEVIYIKLGMAEVVSDSIWDPMSREHLLGTDALGRDMLSRMIYGGRTTIYIATMATVLSFSLVELMVVGMLPNRVAAIHVDWKYFH